MEHTRAHTHARSRLAGSSLLSLHRFQLRAQGERERVRVSAPGAREGARSAAGARPATGSAGSKPGAAGTWGRGARGATAEPEVRRDGWVAGSPARREAAGSRVLECAEPGAGGAEQKPGCSRGSRGSGSAESPTPRGPARLRQRRGEAAGAAR